MSETNTTTNDSARRIYEMRKAHGWTQAQLADAIGTTQAHISTLEHGKRAVDDATMAKIVAAFNAQPPAKVSAPAKTSKFCTWVRNARVARGMTQKDLGAATKMTAAHISNIETGNRAPSVGAVVTICAALSVDANLGLRLAGVKSSDTACTDHARQAAQQIEVMIGSLSKSQAQTVVDMVAAFAISCRHGSASIN